MHKRTEVRCVENRFKTLLFRFDMKGIYVYCRDCRVGGKRGHEHLFTWPGLLKMALGTWTNDQHGIAESGDNNPTES